MNIEKAAQEVCDLMQEKWEIERKLNDIRHNPNLIGEIANLNGFVGK